MTPQTHLPPDKIPSLSLDQDSLLTVETFATLVGATSISIYNRIKHKVIKARRLKGRTKFLHRDIDLIRYLAAEIARREDGIYLSDIGVRLEKINADAYILQQLSSISEHKKVATLLYTQLRQDYQS